MTVAISLDVPRITSERPMTVRAILDTVLQHEDTIPAVVLSARQWRDLEAWKSPDLIERFIRSAAQFVADVAAGEPTWEDAAWQ